MLPLNDSELQIPISTEKIYTRCTTHRVNRVYHRPALISFLLHPVLEARECEGGADNLGTCGVALPFLRVISQEGFTLERVRVLDSGGHRVETGAFFHTYALNLTHTNDKVASDFVVETCAPQLGVG